MTIIGFILLFGLFPYAIGNVGIVGGNDAMLGQFPYQVMWTIEEIDKYPDFCKENWKSRSVNSLPTFWHRNPPETISKNGELVKLQNQCKKVIECLQAHFFSSTTMETRW